MNKLSFSRFWYYLSTAHNLRIVRYLMVGFSNMSVCFLFMYLGSWAGLHYLEYTVLGYLVAIMYSFYMNLRFTFRVSGNILKRMMLFFAVNLTNLALVEGIEYVMIDIWMMNKLLSIFCGMLWYSAVGFTINTLFVYKHSFNGSSDA